MKRESACQRERAWPGSPAASAALMAVLLLSLILLSSSALAYDFAGRVERVSEPNIMWVNVTQPGTYGLQAMVEVLLDAPLEGLAYFRGKDLQFEVQGHDILGRPICKAYLEETDIRDAYYCILYPVECSYRKNAPALGYGWGYGWGYSCDYPRLSPWGRCGNFSPGGNCCPQGYYRSYEYPWLSFI